jgi:hypothetical protein
VNDSCVSATIPVICVCVRVCTCVRGTPYILNTHTPYPFSCPVAPPRIRIVYSYHYGNLVINYYGRYAATNAELGGGNAPASPLLSLQTAGVAKRERWREGPKSKKKSRRAAAHCEAGEQWMRRAAAGGGDGAAGADPLVVSKLNIWWLQSNFMALQ